MSRFDKAHSGMATDITHPTREEYIHLDIFLESTLSIVIIIFLQLDRFDLFFQGPVLCHLTL